MRRKSGALSGLLLALVAAFLAGWVVLTACSDGASPTAPAAPPGATAPGKSFSADSRGPGPGASESREADPLGLKAGKGPKGPKAGQCDSPDVLVCHMDRNKLKPVCVPPGEVGNHVGNHAGDSLADADGDGYLGTACTDGPDCNDEDSDIHPDAADSDCDGVDENCSGQADEGYVAPATSCGVGVCASTGFAECVAGSISDSCSPGSPLEQPEVSCSDNLDNDCDALTDGADDDCQLQCVDSGNPCGEGDVCCVDGQACLPPVGFFDDRCCSPNEFDDCNADSDCCSSFCFEGECGEGGGD